MPFEDTHIDTDEYNFQLAIISDLMDKYPDSHVIFGGDCNVHFSRDQSHTTLLTIFCEDNSLMPTVKH